MYRGKFVVGYALRLNGYYFGDRRSVHLPLAWRFEFADRAEEARQLIARRHSLRPTDIEVVPIVRRIPSSAVLAERKRCAEVCRRVGVEFLNGELDIDMDGNPDADDVADECARRISEGES